MYDIIIIGAGPAGLTAALYARRAEKSVLLIEKETFGGQITHSPRVENYPGFISMSGSELGEKLFGQVLEQGAEIELDTVTGISGEAGHITVTCESCSAFEGKSVIIATGSRHRDLGVDGEEKFVGEGISYCAVCDGAFYKGRTVAVIGGGMIGLIMLQLAKLKGAAKLILLEPVEEKRQLGKKLGADLTIDPLTEDIHQVLHSAGIRRINTVIECVGKPATIRQAIAIAGKKSTVMMFGLTRPDEEVPVKPFELFKKEIVLKASFINPYTQGRALALIAGGRVDVSSMVSNVASLEQLPEILADDSLRRTGKVIISPKL